MIEKLIAVLPAGGSVIALILVVKLFLDHIREFNTKLQMIATDCHRYSEQSQTLYQEQIQQIVNGFVSESTHTREVIQRLDSSVQELSRTIARP